jgi:hypothetical protein
MPRLVLRVERVTLPRVTPMGGGAQSMALEKVNNEKRTSVRTNECHQTLACWADMFASTQQQQEYRDQRLDAMEKGERGQAWLDE